MTQPMRTPDDIHTSAAALQQQLRDIYGIRGRDLAHALRKAHRLLPKSMRQAGDHIVAAQAMIGNPKLERTLDFEGLNAQRDALSAHLDAVDVRDMRIGKLLSLAGHLAFQLIVIAAAFIGWMVWAGHL